MKLAHWELGLTLPSNNYKHLTDLEFYSNYFSNERHY